MTPLAVACAADLGLRARITTALSECGLSVADAATPQAALALAGAPRLLVAAWDAEQTTDRGALRELAREHEELRIIIVCEGRTGRDARLVLERWIDGLVFSDQLELALGPTAIAVLAGQAVVPRRMRTQLRRPALSYREKQILALVVLGYTNSQIGARLFLAESTVKSHLSSAFTKLGVRSRSDAAAIVLDPEESQGFGVLQITEALEQANPDAMHGVGA